MFRFRCLGSGSCGNAYVVDTEKGAFLIDAGVPIRRLRKLLKDYGYSECALKGILLTHDHADHAKNVGTLQQVTQKMGHPFPVYLTKRSWEGIKANPSISKKPMLEYTQFIEKEQPFTLCDVEITPFEVPHDSEDNVGYFLQQGAHTLCIITDAGEVTPTMEKYILRTDQLVIEADYDEVLLAQSAYPYPLKVRIGGEHGHLSNQKTAEILYRHREHLQRVWLCHLSQNTNRPERARNVVTDYFTSQGTDISESFDLEILQRTQVSENYIL